MWITIMYTYSMFTYSILGGIEGFNWFCLLKNSYISSSRVASVSPQSSTIALNFHSSFASLLWERLLFGGRFPLCFVQPAFWRDEFDLLIFIFINGAIFSLFFSHFFKRLICSVQQSQNLIIYPAWHLPPSLSPNWGQRKAICPSVTLTSYVTSCEMSSPESQVRSMLLFVCSLPVLLTAALWCSQQLTLLATMQQQLGVLKHTSCSKWRSGREHV